MRSGMVMQLAEARDDARRAAMVRSIPAQWRRRVGAIHAGKLARARGVRHEIAQRYEIEREADKWLADRAAAVSGLRVPVDISDSDLCEMAERCAHKAMSLGEFAPGYHVADIGALRSRLNAYVAGFGIDAPGDDKEDAPALARMTDPLWWRRQLRKAQGRQLEGAAIGLGFVHRAAEIYASNATVERRTQQRRRNALNLEGTDALNLDTGEVCNLARLAESTVANPRIRRGELMTRIAGFELVARGLGHVAEFVTLTCPSVFHARRVTEGGGNEPNPKHDGSTPKDAARYLGKVWARIRARLARLYVRPYGFRIAEPHHDGCPHWHVLLFVAAVHVEMLRATIKEHAMRKDGDEPGAERSRVKFVAIDMEKAGAAAGYVAKYVSKNIDGGGYVVDADLLGDEQIAPSQRVEAWASTWGIRQFQQIGGAPVGVWRELRRLEAGGDYSDRVEAARKAADCGPISRELGGEQKTAEFWAEFTRVMGGPNVKRDELPVTLAKTRDGERWNAAESLPCPAPLTRYGETAKGAIYGVFDAVKGCAFCTNRGRWEIRRKGAGNAESDWGRVDRVMAGRVRGVADDEALPGCELYPGGVEDQRKGGMPSAGRWLVRGGYVSNPRMPALGFGVPRTRGNNCTHEGESDGGIEAAGGVFEGVGGRGIEKRRDVFPEGGAIAAGATGGADS